MTLHPNSLLFLLKTSRPRFWLYLFGPFFLTITAPGGLAITKPELALILAWSAWLVFFGNLFVYGVNDLYDQETDALNAKKAGYEARVTKTTEPLLRRALGLSLVLGMILFGITAIQPFTNPGWLALGFFGFLLLGWQYSAPPFHLKARPFLDSVSNALYLFPVFIAWSLRSPSSFPWPLFLAGSLWCAAMHAFSAVPDIEADKKAGLATIATQLGAKWTILLCAGLYLAACVLAFPWIHALSWFGAAVYGVLMFIAWRVRGSEKKLFRVYTWFPAINTVIGFLLWVKMMLTSV